MINTFSNITKSLLTFYLIVSFSITILLLIGIYYCHANVEDLELAIYSRELGVYNAWLRLLTTYDGRYSTNLMQGINPLVINNILGYKWMILVGLALLNLAIYTAIKKSFEGVKSLYVFIATLSFSVLYFQQCGSTAYALYWMGSSFVYLYPSIFLLFNIVLFIPYIKTSVPSVLYFFPLTVMLILSIGYSELFLPLYLFLSFLIPIYVYYNYPKLLPRVIPLSIIMWLGISFMITSPGLYFRFNDSDLNNHLNRQIILSSLQNYGIEIKTLLNFPLLLLVILSAILWESSKWSFGHLFSQINLGWVLFLFLTLPYLMSLPYFVTKYSPFEYPVRIYIPIVFVQYVIVFFFIVPILLNKYSNLIFKSIYKLAGFLFLLLFTFQIWSGKGQVGLLLHELLDNKLCDFDTQMTQRYLKLAESRNSKSTYILVELDTLKIYPKSLYTHPDKEFNRNNTKWNKFIEGYFGIDEVKTFGDTTCRFQYLKCDNK
jgi:hypothetical protein